MIMMPPHLKGSSATQILLKFEEGGIVYYLHSKHTRGHANSWI